MNLIYASGANKHVFCLSNLVTSQVVSSSVRPYSAVKSHIDENTITLFVKLVVQTILTLLTKKVGKAGILLCVKENDSIKYKPKIRLNTNPQYANCALRLLYPKKNLKKDYNQ